MRKTIELPKELIDKINEYKKINKLKSFSVAMEQITEQFLYSPPEMSFGEETIGEETIGEETMFALLGDAMVKIDKKLDKLVESLAPKSAGEI